MRTRPLMRSLGAGAPLLISCAAAADPTLTVVSKPVADGDEAFVSAVFNLYVQLDGTDRASNFITAVAGLPGGNEGLVTIVGGVFFQHPLGGRTAPPQEFLPSVPGLAVDSFVTIGRKTDPGDDATGLSPGFPTEDGEPQDGGTWSPSTLLLEDGAWFLTPDDPQGHVGEADNGPDRVLIGQFSAAAGADPDVGIVGQLLTRGVSGGQGFQMVLTFELFIPAPGAAGLLTALALPWRRRRRVGRSGGEGGASCDPCAH